ncbi:MAG: anhydro-N-acetylmuramic acid kinase [Rhodospirillaceae bacterium]|nr:anhydro-N-acetylmuramic acid kinase [Rhodospirillaceae bacterium]
MVSPEVLRVVGLMSGTSMDGIDAALIETDGVRVRRFGPAVSAPYTPAFRAKLRGFVAGVPERGDPGAGAVEQVLTDLHAEAVDRLLREHPDWDADLVGFHGQTVWHRPGQRATWQLGDGPRLARRLGRPVCFDFRSADVAAGGQGAPLAPLFHLALAEPLPRPVAVLNLGGVGNVTWIGDGSIDRPEAADMLAFDTGPGNGLLDDWILKKTGKAMDQDGLVSARGRVDWDVIRAWMREPFFAAPPPKSLDRFAFSIAAVKGLSVENGAATLAAFTANCVHHALQQCPAKPREVLVTGGGRHNPSIMRALIETTGLTVRPIEAIGASGDHLEAQAFAFLAARSRRGLPLTYPKTTGVATPQTGGRIVPPAA